MGYTLNTFFETIIVKIYLNGTVGRCIIKLVVVTCQKWSQAARFKYVLPSLSLGSISYAIKTRHAIESCTRVVYYHRSRTSKQYRYIPECLYRYRNIVPYVPKCRYIIKQWQIVLTAKTFLKVGTGVRQNLPGSGAELLDKRGIAATRSHDKGDGLPEGW